MKMQSSQTHTNNAEITNEANGGRKETGQILTPMICDRNLQVLDRSGIFKNVGQIWRDVHHILQKTKTKTIKILLDLKKKETFKILQLTYANAMFIEGVTIAGILGVAQKQVRKDFDRETRIGQRIHIINSSYSQMSGPNATNFS